MQEQMNTALFEGFIDFYTTQLIDKIYEKGHESLFIDFSNNGYDYSSIDYEEKINSNNVIKLNCLWMQFQSLTT